MTIATREAILKMNIENAVQMTRWTNNTGAAVSVGEVLGIAVGSGHRMAVVVLNERSNNLGAILPGGIGQILKQGRVNIDKSSSVSFTQGAEVWWDASANAASTAAVCNQVADFFVGMCTIAANTAAVFVEVDLNFGPHAFGMGSSSSSSSTSSSSSSSSSSA